MPLDDDALLARSRVRRWFRARLDRAPRRWVLFLAAVEGLVGCAGSWAERTPPANLEAVATVISAGALALAPATALVMLVVHGRLVYWSGKALHGRARPLELHAAAAWSILPLALTGWPDVLRVGVRLLRLDREVVPAWLLAAGDVAEGLARLGRPLTIAAAFVSAALYVIFLAEAQRFTKVRAVLNQLLAGLLFAALLGGGAPLGWLASDHRAVGLPLLSCAALALIGWRIALAGRRPASGALQR